MADKVVIEVQKFDKREGISKGTGKPYAIYTLEDGRSGRKAKTFDGDWVKNWSNGDMVEVIWGDSSEYNGVTTWVITNPNAAPKKPWTGRPGGGFGGAPVNNMVHAMYVAATLLAPRDLDKKIKVENLFGLADIIKKKLDEAAPAPVAAAPAAVAPVQTPTQPAPVAAPVATPPAPVQDTAELAVTEEEDDDKPF